MLCISKMESQLKPIQDRSGRATGLYHDVGYGGVHIGGMTGWSHEATIMVCLSQVSQYSTFDPVEVAHAYLLTHFEASGIQSAVEMHA